MPEEHCRAWRDPYVQRWLNIEASAGLVQLPCRALACQRGITGLGATSCQALARQRGIARLGTPTCQVLAHHWGIAGLGVTPLSIAGTQEGHRQVWLDPPPLSSAGMPEGHRRAWRDPYASAGSTWRDPCERWPVRGASAGAPHVKQWPAREASPGLARPTCQVLASIGASPGLA